MHPSRFRNFAHLFARLGVNHHHPRGPRNKQAMSSAIRGQIIPSAIAAQFPGLDHLVVRSRSQARHRHHTCQQNRRRQNRRNSRSISSFHSHLLIVAYKKIGNRKIVPVRPIQPALWSETLTQQPILSSLHNCAKTCLFRPPRPANPPFTTTQVWHRPCSYSDCRRSLHPLPVRGCSVAFSKGRPCHEEDCVSALHPFYHCRIRAVLRK